MSFPRLLVATEFPPNASGGGPAVVRQMLKDWPAEQLTWWSCLPESDQRFGQKTSSHHVALMPEKLRPHIRFSQIKSALLETFWVPWAARHFRKTVEAERPEAIWVIPHDWSILPISRAIGTPSPASLIKMGTTGTLSLPYHVSMHDYVDVHNAPKRFGIERCARLVKSCDAVYSGALTTDAISKEMAADLEQRTGKAASGIIRYGIEATRIEELTARKFNARKDAIRVGYAGSILVEKEFSLFVQALRKAREVIAKPIHLYLFGANPFSSKPWFDSSWMVEKGNLPEFELYKELEQCDWGFSPMSLTDDDSRYNRFSFPTKFITYLAAGLPVITLGHPESSVVKMARSYDVGLCSSTTDPEALSGQLRAALSDPDPWEHFKGEILRCAQTEFNAEKMRRKLYECLGRDAVPGVPSFQ